MKPSKNTYVARDNLDGTVLDLKNNLTIKYEEYFKLPEEPIISRSNRTSRSSSKVRRSFKRPSYRNSKFFIRKPRELIESKKQETQECFKSSSRDPIKKSKTINQNIQKEPLPKPKQQFIEPKTTTPSVLPRLNPSPPKLSKVLGGSFTPEKKFERAINSQEKLKEERSSSPFKKTRKVKAIRINRVRTIRNIYKGSFPTSNF